MKSDRHTDVWLERACNLTAVGLSVTAAFLLSFDFSIPAGLAPILKQAVLIAILVKLPIFDWVGFYRGLRRFVSIPDLYVVFLGNLAGSALFAACLDVLDRADDTTVGFPHRHVPMFFDDESGAVFGPYPQ